MKLKAKKVFLILAMSFPVFLSAQDMKLKLTVGNKEFTATLSDNDAAKELVRLLPMEVTMDEHNGNEKYYNLPDRIPGKATNPGSVQAGDLMIWSSGTLVLFYGEGRTSYSYIRVGKIDNPSGLREAVGRGRVKVKYELLRQEEKKNDHNKQAIDTSNKLKIEIK